MLAYKNNIPTLNGHLWLYTIVGSMPAMQLHIFYMLITHKTACFRSFPAVVINMYNTLFLTLGRWWVHGVKITNEISKCRPSVIWQQWLNISI